MKIFSLTIAVLLYSGLLTAQTSLPAGITPTDVVKKANEKIQGEESSYSEMRMKIVRPSYDREIAFKSWTLGSMHSLVLITSPAKEKGQTFLKRDREMWNWNPSISRMIKLPPSMLSQGWMGSDFTNDDLLNQSSIVVDYTHNLVKPETVEGMDCYVIELIPHDDAPVVWGKMELWISKDEYIIVKATYYDEDEFLVKTELGKEIKVMDGRKVASLMELIPADEEGHKTMVYIDKIDFNIKIQDSFFSQQNMKRIR